MTEKLFKKSFKQYLYIRVFEEGEFKGKYLKITKDGFIHKQLEAWGGLPEYIIIKKR